MRDYETLNIERDHSKYPSGLKHYSKERLFENSLFDFELVKYKIKSLWKGNEDGKRDKTRSEEKGNGSAKEVLFRFMFGLLYEDRDTTDREREDRRIEDRYCEADEREREATEESDPGSLEEKGFEEEGR